MSIYTEVWTRPGDSNFGRVIDGLPTTSFGLHDGMNIVGDGIATVPDTFDRFDEILKLDLNTPADSVSSLIRLFSDADPTTPIFEWIPSLILPTSEKLDRTVEITGKAIDSILGYARTDAFDWDGSDDWEPRFPDWIWGGRNILRNPGFELSGIRPAVWSVWNDATGGTFTLSRDGQTTAAIAFNASSTTVNNAIEALSTVTDVLVSGSGTQADPWRIEFVEPAVAATAALTGDGSGLTGATEGLVLELVQAGDDEIADVWNKSQRSDRRSVVALHGCSNIFRRSSGAEPVRTGSYSLVLSPCTSNGQYAGGQQILQVQEGGTYQASIWVRANTSGQTFRLVMRDRYERILTTASGAEAFVEVTPAANTWTQLSITDVKAELHENGEEVSEMVFRWAYVNSNPSGISYWDDAEFTEGLAADNMGNILTALYDSYVDSGLRNPIVWDDSGSPYLTLDFDGTNDSGGNPWWIQDHDLRIWMRMTFLDVLEQISRSWGYEWRVVADDVENGTWLLQVYNPGTMSTDYTTAASPAIQGGSSTVRRRIVRFLPQTDFLVEGEDAITSRDRNTDLITALGRIETSRLDRELPNTAAVQDAVFEDKQDAIPNSSSFSYVVVDPQDEPLTDYVVGDILTIHDPPEVEASGRLMDVVGSFTPSQQEWELDFVPLTASGS